VIWNQKWPINLESLLQRFAQEWQEFFPAGTFQALVLANDLTEFFSQRWISLMEEEGLDSDVVQAIVAASALKGASIVRDPLAARDRALFLQSLRREGRLSAIQSVVQRASRLASKGDLGREVLRPREAVDPALFVSKSEAQMFAVLERVGPHAEAQDQYAELAFCLQESATTLAEFFDGADSVLVMCDDLTLRRNRLNLLAVLRNQAEVLADFNQLEG
jgi:glycyl-tRNA synthetase beta chain